jgi:malate dehydrogenase
MSKANFSRPKIGLVGAGQIGGNLAMLAAWHGLGDVVLLDIDEGIPKGKALDISQMGAASHFDGHIIGTANYADLSHADVVIITAGLPRKPGMSRDDLLDTNVNIMKTVGQNLRKHCPNAFTIVVSNPLDAMVYALAKVTEFPDHQVVGMAGVLDSSRFRYFVASELGVCLQDVQAFVLGGHGDDMVPVVQWCSVGGIPLPQLMDASKIESIIQRTRLGGGEIVGLLKTGSAYYAPAASAIAMATAYIEDSHRLLPAAARCQGQYGIQNLFVGVPIQIGRSGVEKIFEVQLSKEDLILLQKSAEHVQQLVEG